MTENKINSSFSETIKRLAQEKGANEEKIKSLIIKSFCQFYEQKLNQTANLHFEFGSELLVYRLYQIVDHVSDPEKEISSSDPRLKEGKKENNTFFLPLEITDYSLDLISEIKKKFRTGLREINWENQFKLLKKLQQEERLVRGNIQGQKGDYYLVNLNLDEEGRVIGFWEKKEWVSTRENPRLGQSFSFLIKEVSEKLEEKWPPLILTRTGDSFLLQVLKFEVPELKEGVITVRQILRSPDSTKIVVESKKKGVDPVGACIGIEAVRIKSISRSLFPERIDIINWADKKETLERSEPSPKELGSYKNIRIRTSEETSSQKTSAWTKKFNINK
ncbi:MAG: hypothetical protein I3273_02130 [Candidatus Moeniiplasma glomeromycotorum]|nr:hypothetical protein [Candidatus Moeniiplasma glomeromycotorum]MCE8167082.1 hypothetical protein [Candidatus Moeniiplasma glomeromycotorum]MCE8168906.1 hypothetical protein [Candidatus Moeniiplasma glomeromycotorum]